MTGKCQVANIIGPLQQFNAQRLDQVHLVLVGPLPYLDGHEYFRTRTSRFIRWTIAFIIPDFTDETLSRGLAHTWIAQFHRIQQ